MFFFLKQDPDPGSSFKNSELQDPDPAENGPDPQPCSYNGDLVSVNFESLL